jgi:hypothetical protein
MLSDKAFEPESEPDDECECDGREQKIAKLIDEAKNVMPPKEVYLWESSPAPSPAASLERAVPTDTVAIWAAALLSAAEEWLRGQAAAFFAEDVPMQAEDAPMEVDVEPGHGLVNRWNKAVQRAQAASSSDAVGSTGAAGHRDLAVPARRDVPVARGSVSEPPRPPTHTPEQEMAARLRAFEKETEKKLCAKKTCNLCAKAVDEWHCKSAGHLEKRKESALLDHLAGTVENIRSLTPCER